MSAIAGIWHLDGAPGPEDRLERMLAALARYGPDNCSHWVEGPCALGRRLMAFLPEDRFDAQPLGSSDQRVQLVADVRLDNRSELAAKLGLSAGELCVTPDSALLLAAWCRWDERCVEHLAGDFAFAVWNRLERRLVLARDHTGTRPLYYHCQPGKWFAFASMPKGLHALPEIPVELDEDRVALFLALISTEQGRLLFRGIERLGPAGLLTITERGVSLSRYWDPGQSPDVRLGSDQEYLEAFRERLDAAVESRLRRVGGIASYLSAGLDSGSVTASAARLLAVGSERLTAFTAVPRPNAGDVGPGRFGNEGAGAADLAGLYPNVDHVLLESSASSFLDRLDPLIADSDGPPFNPTNTIWLDAIQREAGDRGLRVILSGAIGNATISQHGMGALSEWFRQGRWIQLARTSWELHSRGNGSWPGLASRAIVPSLPYRLRRRLSGRRFSLSYSLVHPAAAERLGLMQRAWEEFHPPRNGARSGFRQLLDQADFGPAYLATRANHRVDERDPTRDKRLIEFCFGIPIEQLLRGGQSRSLVRRAMQGRLPAATLKRASRGLQSADWHLGMESIRDEMLHEVELLEGSPMARRLLDLERARHLLRHWPSSGFHTSEVKVSWHLALSRGLGVGRFIRRFDPEANRP